MKIRILGLVVGVSVLAMWGTACEQPSIDCRALHSGPYAAKYTLISGGMECSGLKGEPIGLQSYYPARADKKNVDLTQSFLVIRPTTLGNLEIEAGDWGDEATVTKAELDAKGSFAVVEPNDNDVCMVPTFSASEVDLKEIPANMDDPENPYPGLPATNVKYEWKDVRLLVSAGAPGNLMEGELTYTENGCTATYSVIALWPTVGCEELDAEGNGTGKPNDKLCDAEPDPQAPYSIPFGSGVNQDFAPKCDPDLLYCVATKTDLIGGRPE